jgi:hypothetical protein
VSGSVIGRKEDSTNLNIDLVAAKNNWDILADTVEVAMPIGDVFVRDAGGDVEHDDTALALDIVAITETAKLLLSSGIPNVEADRAKVGREGEGVDLDTERGWLVHMSTRSRWMYE